MSSDQSLTTTTASMKLNCDTLNVVKNKTPATSERAQLKWETNLFYLKTPLYLSRTSTRKQVERQKKKSPNQLGSKSNLEVVHSKSLPRWLKADTMDAQNLRISSSKPTLTLPKQSTTLSPKPFYTPGNNELSIATDVKLSSNSGTKKSQSMVYLSEIIKIFTHLRQA